MNTESVSKKQKGNAVLHGVSNSAFKFEKRMCITCEYHKKDKAFVSCNTCINKCNYLLAFKYVR